MTKRVEQIKASGIRKIFEKAASMKDVINLSIGQPDFPVPTAVKESMINAINNNKNGYTPSAGLPDLNKKILDNYQTDKFTNFAQKSILTSGVSGGIFLSYSALLEEGEEIIVFDPYFVMYPDLAKFLNIKPVIVKTNQDYSINFDLLKQSITPNTKAIIINTPNNPSGHTISREELTQLSKIAKENDLWIISDEVYSPFDYDNTFVSAGMFHEKTIVLNGYSKSHALTGLRLGYAVGPEPVINDMIKLQQYTFVCAPSIAQYGVLENFQVDISENIESLKEKMLYIHANLKDKFTLTKPGGAFYYLIKTPKGLTGTELCDLCLEKNLLVVPGGAFSLTDDTFRISYAASWEHIKEGCNILNSLA